MKKKISLLIFLIIFTVAISGCLGGGGEDSGEPEITYAVKSGGRVGPIEGHTEESDETSLDIVLITPI